MTLTRTQKAWQAVKRWLPGVAVSVLVLWLLLRSISWEKVGQALAQTRWSTLLLAILVYLVSMAVRALCWHTLLQRKVPYIRAFFVMNEGYLLNNVFPLRLGEFGRAVLMGRYTGKGFLATLSTIVVERIYDIAIAASLFLSMLPLLLSMQGARPLAITVLGVVLAALVLLYGMARNRGPINAWLTRLGEHSPRLARLVIPQIQSVLEGFAVLTRPSLFVQSLGLLGLSWALAILEDYILLRNWVPEAQFWWVAFVLAAGALGAALPSIPGSVGVFEGSVVAALSLVGVDPARALAFALIVHIIQLVFSSLFGLLGLTQEGQSLSSLYSDLVARRQAG